ncbi:cob(I)yrinic acid a,c-diamide adenosyltransferase [Crocinitomicaceae bacterium]|jgi:cob(I)alamin adenosyltransferase|nr:cob(I)yrinic acid a,c-diamide adenosyltransferase [Crocinitomicaceae bacterium]MDC0099701.1 cob(I)yrinic acid a,c-diamide adenosyltransferase [Crocinitomicaceae bacterium]MDC1282927.1 cob(I)yrinic acid a,c-diamide adenosyltransferase [Crocinitomicaceae bacterium]|tara:strand:+ start:40 stop:588 length:549 start_codon:yes stop_codon:yes gene_type:complete
MKVYTKKGDSGTTQLIGGTRVVKSSMRIEAYGTVDELNSYLGLIRDQAVKESQAEQLLEIQDRLFTMGSLLATDPKGTKMKLPQLQDSDIESLENWIDEMEETLEPMTSFVLPGGHTAVSFCHIARCVCRRAERIVVDLNENEKIEPIILTYLNRLSDYMFVLSRKLTLDLKANEIPWKPRM